jgi:hypothetical protein
MSSAITNKWHCTADGQTSEWNDKHFLRLHWLDDLRQVRKQGAFKARRWAELQYIRHDIAGQQVQIELEGLKSNGVAVFEKDAKHTCERKTRLGLEHKHALGNDDADIVAVFTLGDNPVQLGAFYHQLLQRMAKRFANDTNAGRAADAWRNFACLTEKQRFDMRRAVYENMRIVTSGRHSRDLTDMIAEYAAGPLDTWAVRLVLPAGSASCKYFLQPYGSYRASKFTDRPYRVPAFLANQNVRWTVVFDMTDVPALALGAEQDCVWQSARSILIEEDEVDVCTNIMSNLYLGEPCALP